MKGKRMVIVFLIVAVISSIALYVWKSREPHPPINKIDDNQYLNLSLTAEPKVLDPSKAVDLSSSQILTEVMEGLTRVEQDKNGKDEVRAAGAENWSMSADGLTWTFILRDYYWSDGQKVKASDFEYGIKRTLDPKNGSSYAFLLYPIKGAKAYNSKRAAEDQVGVKAIDDKTLEFKLEAPCPYFLQLTYLKVMYPQRKDIIEKYGDKYGSEINTMLFCGPFTINNWVHQNKVELIKNDKYWDEKSVKLSKVTFNIIKDDGARMNGLVNNSLDASVVSKEEWISKLDALGKFTTLKGFEPTTGFNFFNQKDKLFNNVKVRKAFSIAANREEIAKNIYNNLALPAYGWCPPKVEVGNEEFREKANFEPVKELVEENKDPKALLIQGLKELKLDTDTSKITVKLLQLGTDSKAKQFAQLMQKDYQEALGVKIEIDQVDWTIFQKRIDNMDYELGCMAWSGDYNDPLSEFDIWVSGSGMVPTGWINTNYDNLIKKAQSSLDENIRFEAFKAAEKILLYDDAVICPTVYRKRIIYSAKYVKGISSPLFGAGIEIKYGYTEGRESK